MDLFQQSIDIILTHQHKGGAYVACPTFPTYNYSWFRDGSFIAYAMDRVKQHESSRRFHVWCAQVVERQSKKIERLVARKHAGESISSQECLTARYTLEGHPTDDDWTDFQLDGYGTWLWALNEYVQLSGDNSLISEVTPSINLVLQYLIAFWDSPCYDCWEEHLDAVHPYTLASIYAGLKAAQQLNFTDAEFPLTKTSEEILVYLEEKTIHPNGYYRKMIFPSGNLENDDLTNLVDASLIGLAVPYGIHPLNERSIRSTMKKIEDDLYFPNGGVYRYLKDTYYGGGEWVLLAAWLGWYWCRDGQFDKAKKIKIFIQAQEKENGSLPEQISDHLLDPPYYQKWVNRWGAVATPLLWSQAMYIILCEELKEHEEND